MKVRRVDSWDALDCPCCKQLFSLMVAVPESAEEGIVPVLSSTWAAFARPETMEAFKCHMASMKPVGFNKYPEPA